MSGRSYSAAQVAIAHDDAHVEARLRLATPPASVSPVVPVAPARGRVVAQPQERTVMTPNGPRPVKDSVDGFHPGRCEDVFDRMSQQAKRRAKSYPIFTVGQVNAGRAYAALWERCASEGLRCWSPEARGGGGGEAVAWIDRVLSRRELLVMIQSQIGDGLALSRRGAMAHADRPGVSLSVRDLVDAVCLHDRSVSEVLVSKAWEPNGRNIDRARAALCAALDRMSLATDSPVLDMD